MPPILHATINRHNLALRLQDAHGAVGSGYGKSPDYGEAEPLAWARYFYRRFLAAWRVAVRVGSWPGFARTTVAGDPHAALLDECRELAPGQKLTFLPDVVTAAYGTPERAMFDLRSDLGDPLGERFRIRFYAGGEVTVSLVESLAPARTSSLPG